MAYDDVLAGRKDVGAAAVGACRARRVRLGSWRTCDQFPTGRGLDPGLVAARLVSIAVRAFCADPGAVS
jgi:hypothetical protein